MRFNKAELVTLATNPTTKYEREGLLIITERQEGFFRRADVNHPRWCKLRGNLLFYLKDQDPRSPPIGLIVLENCRPLVKNEDREFDGFAFILEFEGSFPQRLSARTAKERLDWIKSIQLASYSYLCRQITYLNQQIADKMGNRIQAGTPIGAAANDATLTNLAAAETALATTSASSNMVTSVNKLEEDLTEIPICESAISCAKLPLDEQGRPPNPRIVVAVLSPGDDLLWRDFARTEIVLRTVNPQFLCTICFRQSDGFTADSVLRFTVYDVREKVSSTSVPLGHAEVALGVIQDGTRFRIPMRSLSGDCGFITISSWAPDAERLMPPPPRSTTQVFEQPTKGHRRSQSLPPKLCVKLFVPFQAKLQTVFANPKIQTYRLHSSMGGDISVHECMLESKLCFALPQQLLSLWILREKELLQEISGMGELGGEWRRKQMDLLDKHLKLLKDYSQAKQNLQQITKEAGPYFKRSSVKTDKSLEFIPVNLHLQRMWTQNDTLNKRGLLDIVTVGAFTRHAGKTGTGGLIKLLQVPKESPSKFESGSVYKVQAANNAVQAVKQLRKEIVDIMSQLLYLAKRKNPKGMMALCNEMVSKTKKLLNIWEPCLVEEAFAFIEQHRILEEPDNVIMPMSPFRKITEQLSALDLKSPELENFATPVVAPPDLWPHTKHNSNHHHSAGGMRKLGRSHSLRLRASPSASDLNAIHSLQTSVQRYNEQLQAQSMDTSSEDAEASAASSNQQFQSLPVTLNQEIGFFDTHFDQRCGLTSSPTDHTSIELIDLDEVNVPEQPSTSTGSPQPIQLDGLENLGYTSAEYAEDDGFMPTNCSIALRHNTGFLDTKTMSNSPSANYYRPTEEPEPLDLTQLNIEASVMCLVSKIKFLCGRCGSPAIRLRHPKTTLKRASFKNAPAPDVVVSQSVVCATDLAGSSENEDNSEQQHEANMMSMNDSAREFNLDLTQQTTTQHHDLETVVSKDIEQQDELPKKGNKFTDGLDLSLTTDWASELRPSMRKLRYAMDGLLKTARLMHSVQRLQQDMKRNSINLEIMYRRDVCFSQAFTALVSGLMAKLWGSEINENYIRILSDLGPLAYFEGLLSLYGNETDIWGDMCIGIEDLQAINFTLVRCNLQRDSLEVPTPRVTGTRLSLTVLLPVPEHVFVLLPTKAMLTFKITPVFFNIGINEKATIAETLGYTRDQHRSNWDNFVRLKQYFNRFRQLPLQTPHTPSKQEPHPPVPELVGKILATIEDQLRANVSKNVKILQLAEDVCRFMSGLRFTSCKSAKDRTGMAVTLEQSRVLLQEFQLPAKAVPTVLSTMRSEGTRMDNVFKNIDKRKYAFNLPQVLSLPTMYRPPVGCYGKAET